MATHLMTDIETLGTDPNSMILSIGACAFDMDKGITQSFYRRIDPESDPDGVIMPSTVLWWMSQSDQARHELLKEDKVSLHQALVSFRLFVSNVGPKYCWARGPDFDYVLLKMACERKGLNSPVKFWEYRDCRTIEMLAKDAGWVNDVERQGAAHNAVVDAHYQAHCVISQWHHLTGG